MHALIFVASLLTAGGAAVQTVAQTPDASPVVAAERAFAADFPAMGLAGSFRKWSLPDSIIISRGQARTVDAVFEGAPLTRQPDEALLEWWPNFAGIARSGDLGFTTGGVAVNGERTGHYFTIWKRQPDGSWKWIYDGGSGASAAEVPGPETEPVILPTATGGDVSPAAAMSAIRAREAALATMSSADQKRAHLQMMADNGRIYVGSLAPAIGRHAVAFALGAWPSTFNFGPAQGADVSLAGDLAWTYGTADWTEDGQARTGHYVRVWQRQNDDWRIVLAQLIPAPPPAEG